MADYAGKAAAIPERLIADRRYAGGYGYAGKAGATEERVFADSRYAVGYGYTGKAGAKTERTAADRCYTGGYGHAGKAGAIREHIIIDRRYAVGYGYTGKAEATSERIAADRCYAVGDGYAGKAGATVERRLTDRRYACINGYASKPGTFVERNISQIFLECYRIITGGKYMPPITAGSSCNIIVVYNDAGKAGATGERLLSDRRYACINGYACKPGTIGERIISRIFLERYRIIAGRKYMPPITAVSSCNNIVVYNDAGKSGATVERLLTDSRYAGWYVYAGKGGTTVERLLSDRRYACINGYACKPGTIIERIISRIFLERYRIIAGGKYMPPITAGSSCNIIVVYNNAGKAGATGERLLTDSRYAGGYVYAGKGGTILERILSDRRYACGDSYIAAYFGGNKNKCGC